ncbi:hypothetical protein C1X98_31530, partial [Pseudomonas sp. FW306-2-11BA]
GASAQITDFEGRKIEREASSLKIAGDAAAHIIVRFRNMHPASATVNGTAAKILTGADGQPFVEFDHAKTSMIAWQ